MNDFSLDHEQHDTLLIATHAAGDLAGNDARRADALVRDCAACAALAADLRALASAVRDLPAPVHSRDFTLTPDDAARLRPAGWRRIRQALRGDGFRLARPVGAGLASLGLAGLVFASTVGGVAPPEVASGAAGEAGALQEIAAPSDLGTSTEDGARAGGAAASAATLREQQPVTAQERELEPDREPAADAPAGETAAASTPNEAMIVVSGSLFIVGIGLFGLRWTSDRLDS